MRLNFRTKLLLGFLSYGAVLLGLVIGYIYFSMADLPLVISRELLLTGVANAAQRINAADVEAIPRGGNLTAGQPWKRMHGIFRQIHEAPPYFAPQGLQRRHRPGPTTRRADGAENKDVFLVVRTDRPNVGMLLVALDPNEVGRPCDMRRNPAMMDGWNGLSATEDIVEDDHGRGLSAYAPIRNAKGEAVALLGMKARGEMIEAAGRGILHVALAIFAVALAGSFVPAAWLSWRINRPIRLLHEGMEQLARGRLDTRIQRLRTRDEFEPLIDRFNEMAAGLGERDQMKRSLALAMEIQQHLLPQEQPVLANLDVAGQSRYCDETGGDYYDFIDLMDLGPEKIAVAVGDVTGHGIGAALLMASARAVLRSHAPRHGADLTALFAAINSHLVRDTGDERFMTLFYGILDGRERSLLWASGGHDPALWYRAESGEIEELPNTGIPLGVLEPMDFQQAGPVKLAAGDIVLVGTDGIWEAANAAGERFGKHRLRETLLACRDRSAAEIRSAVIAAVGDFRGDVPQQDDITLVVIKGR